MHLEVPDSFPLLLGEPEAVVREIGTVKIVPLGDGGFPVVDIVVRLHVALTATASRRERLRRTTPLVGQLSPPPGTTVRRVSFDVEHLGAGRHAGRFVRVRCLWASRCTVREGGAFATVTDTA